MKKNNLPKRVSIATKVNGKIALEMRMKSPRACVHTDRKKENKKRQCRSKVSF